MRLNTVYVVLFVKIGEKLLGSNWSKMPNRHSS